MSFSAGSSGVEQEGLDLGIEIPAPPTSEPKVGVTWFGYKHRNPVHCDLCLAEVHARWPNGTHAPNRAVYRRKENGVDTYWCSIHAEPRRDADGVSRAKPKKKRRDV